MSGIFLSYSRADRPTAQGIAEALQAEGFTVWWDKILRAGETYDEVTERMLRVSNVVVVLWSKTSVKSKWVRAEATLGQRNAVVIPAMIEDADRPIMFELTQTADLIGWNGDRSNEHWQNFVADIRRVIEQAEPDAGDQAPAAAAELPPSSPPAPDATIENTYWMSIQNSTDPAELESYLKRYPNGHFSDLAKRRMAALTAKAAPAAPVEPAPAPPTPPPPEPVKVAAAPYVAPAPAEKKGKSNMPWIVAAVLGVGALGVGTALMLPKPIKSAEAATEPETPAKAAAACAICPDMVSIPGGTFLIGSPDSEYARVGNEGPQTEITLTPFQMSRTEITQGEWDACVEGGGCRKAGSAEAAFPVVSVSWDDANDYTRWLSSETGKAYRLPTEAEWEYAARARTTTAYWWGDRYDRSKIVSGGAVEVTSLPENPFGLIGMLGNVREWVEDCYVNNYNDADANGRAMRGGSCNLRVVRGGSFKEGAAEHRSANRARISKSTRDTAVGFRVVSSGGG